MPEKNPTTKIVNPPPQKETDATRTLKPTPPSKPPDYVPPPPKTNDK